MKQQEIAKTIKARIKKDFRKTWTELKKEIKNSLHPVNGSEHFKSKYGYSIFYTNNPNFMQGKKNGGGVGFFANVRFVPGMVRTIKL